jgi:tetratricopeptide (TPR) repeat protein
MKINQKAVFAVAVLLGILSSATTLRLEAATSDELFQKAFLMETGERDIEKAIGMYKEVVDQSKDNPAMASKAEYRMALCYERLGKVPEAIATYEKVIELNASSTTETTESARANAQRLKNQLDQEQNAKLAASLELPEEQSRGRRFNRSVHSINIISLAWASNPGLGDKNQGGSELFGYEYIHRSGLGFRLVPINVYQTENSTHWAPIWARYYVRGWPKKVWPFVGMGFDVYSVSAPTNSQNGTTLALELGINCGEKLIRRHTFSVKILPEGMNLKNSTFAFTYGFSFGFQSRER